MAITINRPAGIAKPAGLLGYEQFQTAYVTNDLDRAMETFRRSYNIAHWTMMDAGVMQIGLAWSNGQQIELIQTGSDPIPLYDDWIDKAGDFVIRHHHFGYFIHSDEEWALLRKQIAADGRPMLLDIEIETLRAIYVSAPELGHFLEYIFPNEQGKAFFESVAAN